MTSVVLNVLYRNLRNEKVTGEVLFHTEKSEYEVKALLHALFSSISAKVFNPEDVGIEPLRTSNDLGIDKVLHEFYGFRRPKENAPEFLYSKFPEPFENFVARFLEHERNIDWTVYEVAKGKKYDGPGYLTPPACLVEDTIANAIRLFQKDNEIMTPYAFNRNPSLETDRFLNSYVEPTPDMQALLEKTVLDAVRFSKKRENGYETEEEPSSFEPGC